MLLTGILLLLVSFLSVRQDTYPLTLNKTVNLKLENCQLHFLADSSVSDPRIGIKSSQVYTETTLNEEGSNFNLTIINNSEVATSCIVYLHYPTGSLNQLNVECDLGDCALIQESIEPLKINTMNVLSYKGEVDLNFVNLESSNLLVDIDTGVISIHHAIISGEASLSTLNGDIIFQSSSSFDPQWKNQNQFYCLAYPSSAGGLSGTFSDQCTTPNDGSREKSKALNCTANLSLISENGGHAAPISLNAPHGVLYANVIPGLGKYVPLSGYNVTQGPGFSLPLNFTDPYNLEFKETITAFNDLNTQDKIISMTIGNWKARSSGSAHILISPNSAYFDMRPYSTSIFSLWLLLSEPLYPRMASFMPGFCPYRNTFSAQQYAQIVDFTKSHFQKFSDLEILEPSYLFSNSFVNSSGFVADRVNELWLVPEQQEFLTISQQRTDSFIMTLDEVLTEGALLAAVIISLLLTFILFLVALYVLYAALSYIFNRFTFSSLHLKQYSKSYFQKNKQILQIEESAINNPILLYTIQKMRLQNIDEIDREQINKIQDPEVVTQPQGQISKARILTTATNFFKNIPPPFAFVDHFFIILINKWRSSSAEYFYLIFGKPLTRQQFDASNEDKFLNLNQIDSLYEKFCFLTQRSQQELKGPEVVKVLLKYGYKYVTEVGTGKEVFTNIRFKDINSQNRKEVTETKKTVNSNYKAAQNFLNHQLALANKNLTEESSLQCFITENCEITKFDTDSVTIEEFRKRYFEFCEENKLVRVPLLSKKIMLSQFKINSRKQNQTFIVPDDSYAGTKRTKFYIPSLRWINNELDRLLHLYAGKLDLYEAKANVQEMNLLKKGRTAPEVEPGDPFTSYWWLIDLGTSISHFSVMFLLFSLPLILAIYSQITISWYSLNASNQKLTYVDLYLTPWTIPYKLFNSLSPFAVFLLCIELIYLITALAEMCLYYSTMRFPIETITIFDPQIRVVESKNKCKYYVVRTSQVTSFLYIVLLAALILAYIGLVLTWSILGAILNPTTYLAYATSAFTLATFIVAKINQLQVLRQKGFSAVLQLVEQQTGELFKMFMVKYLGQDEEQATAQAQALKLAIRDPTRSDQAMLSFVANTSAGTKLEQMLGMEYLQQELPLLLRVIKDTKDEEALQKMGQVYKVPPSLIMLIVSIVKLEHGNIIDALKRLVALDPFRLPAQVVDFVVSLLFNSGQFQMKDLINLISKKLFIELKEKEGQDLGYLDQLEISFPLIFQSIYALLKGDVEESKQLLFRFNEAAIQGETSIREGKRSAPEDLSSEQFTLKHSLPKVFYQQLEFMKIRLSCIGKNQSIDKEKLYSALQSIFNDFLKLPPQIFDFLKLISLKSEDIKRDPKMISKIKNFAQSVNLDASLLLLSFKFRLNLRQDSVRINEYPLKFINEVANIDESLRSPNESYRDIFTNEALEPLTSVYELLNASDPIAGLDKAIVKYETVDQEPLQKILSFVFPTCTHGQRLKQAHRDMISQFSKFLFLTQKETSGLFKYFKREKLLSNSSFAFLKALASRMEQTITEETLERIQALLCLSGAQTVNETLGALDRIKEFQGFSKFALVFKRFLRPGDLQVQDYNGLDLQSCDIIEKAIYAETYEEISEWIQKFQSCLIRNSFEKTIQDDKQDFLLDFKGNIEAQQHLHVPHSMINLKSSIFARSRKKISEKKPDQNIEPLIGIIRMRYERSTEEKMKFLKMLIELCFDNNLTAQSMTELFPEFRNNIEKFNDIFALLDILHQEQTGNSMMAIQSISDILGVDVKYLRSLFFINNVAVLTNQQSNKLTAYQNEYNINESLTTMFPNCKHIKFLTNFTLNEIATKIHYLYELEFRIASLSEKIEFPETMARSLFLGRIEKYLTKKPVLSEFRRSLGISGISVRSAQNQISCNEFLTVLQAYFFSYISQDDRKSSQKYFLLQKRQSELVQLLINRTFKDFTRLIDFIIQTLHKLGYTPEVRTLLVGIILMQHSKQLNLTFKNMSSIPQLQPNGKNFMLYFCQILSSILKVPQEFLTASMNSHNEKPKRIQDELELMFKTLHQSKRGPKELKQTTTLMLPGIFEGISAILSGIENNTEEIAEKVRTKPSLIDSCILLANIAKNCERSYVVCDLLEILEKSASFKEFLDLVALPQNVVLRVLRMSFNQCQSLSVVRQFLQMTEMEGKVDENIMLAICSLVNYSKTNRHSALQNTLPLVKVLNLNPELSLLSLRLHYRDYNAIDGDFQQFLSPLLPNREIKNFAKGFVALLSDDEDDFLFGIKQLADNLKINPLLFQLCFGRKGVYCKLEYEHEKEIFHDLKILLLILIASILKSNTGVHLHLLESQLWRLVKGTEAQQRVSVIPTDIKPQNADQVIGVQKPHILFSVRQDPMRMAQDPEETLKLKVKLVSEEEQYDPQDPVVRVVTPQAEREEFKRRAQASRSTTPQNMNKYQGRSSQLYSSPYQSGYQSAFHVMDYFQDPPQQDQDNFSERSHDSFGHKSTGAQLHRIVTDVPRMDTSSLMLTQHYVPQQSQDPFLYTNLVNKVCPPSQVSQEVKNLRRMETLFKKSLSPNLFTQAEEDQFQHESKQEKKEEESQPQPTPEDVLIYLDQFLSLERYVLESKSFFKMNKEQVLEDEELKRLYETANLASLFDIPPTLWDSVISRIMPPGQQSRKLDVIHMLLSRIRYLIVETKFQQPTLAQLVFVLNLFKLKKLIKQEPNNFLGIMACLEPILNYLSILDVSQNLFKGKFDYVRIFKFISLVLGLPISNAVSYWRDFEYFQIFSEITRSTQDVPFRSQNSNEMQYYRAPPNIQQKVEGLYRSYEREPIILLSSLIEQIEIDPQIYNWRYDDINFLNPAIPHNWCDPALAPQLTTFPENLQYYKNSKGENKLQLLVPKSIGEEEGTDQVTGLSNQYLRSFFQMLEVFTVQRALSVQTILGLSCKSGIMKNEQYNELWVNVRTIIKEEQKNFNDKTLILYKDFYSLISCQALIKMQYAFSLKTVISNLFQYSRKLRLLDIQLLQDLVLISHNVINEKTVRKLASSFLIRPERIKLFFISAQDSQLTEEQLREFKIFGVDREQVLGIHKALKNDINGWSKLYHCICQSLPTQKYKLSLQSFFNLLSTEITQVEENTPQFVEIIRTAFEELNIPHNQIDQDELSNVLKFIRGCVEWFAIPNKPKMPLIDSIVDSMQNLSSKSTFAVLLHNMKTDPLYLKHFFIARKKQINLSFQNMKSLLLLGSCSDYKISERDFEPQTWLSQNFIPYQNLQRLVYDHCNCEQERAHCFVQLMFTTKMKQLKMLDSILEKLPITQSKCNYVIMRNLVKLDKFDNGSLLRNAVKYHPEIIEQVNFFLQRAVIEPAKKASKTLTKSKKSNVKDFLMRFGKQTNLKKSNYMSPMSSVFKKKKQSLYLRDTVQVQLYKFDVLRDLRAIYLETRKYKKESKEIGKYQMLTKSKRNSLEELLRAILVGNLKDVFEIFSRPDLSEQAPEPKKYADTVEFYMYLSEVIAMKQYNFQNQVYSHISQQTRFQLFVECLVRILEEKMTHENQKLQLIIKGLKYRLALSQNKFPILGEGEEAEQQEEHQNSQLDLFTRSPSLRRKAKANMSYYSSIALLKKWREEPKQNNLVAFVLEMLFALRFDHQRRKIIQQKIQDALSFIINSSTNTHKSDYKKIIGALYNTNPSRISFLGFTMSSEEITMIDRILLLGESILSIYFGPLLAKYPELFQKITIFLGVIHELIQATIQDSLEETTLRIAPEISQLFGVDKGLFSNVIKALNFDIMAVVELLEPISYINPDDIRSFIEIINEVLSYSENYSVQLKKAMGKDQILQANSFKDMLEKIERKEATERDLFRLIDSEFNNSGQIQKDEFQKFMQRIGLDFSMHRVNQIYSSVQSKTNDDNAEALTEEEFILALRYVKETTSQGSMRMLSLSVGDMVIFFAFILLILLLLFTFVLLGITALANSSGGTFSAVINSAMPILAGVFVGRAKKTDVEEEPVATAEAVRKSEKIMTQVK